MAYIKNKDKLRIIVLEDLPNRVEFFISKLKGHDVYYFDSADDVINALEFIVDKPWDIIFLGHDLEHKIFVPSTHHNTGYTVAKYIAGHDELQVKQIVIHSMNEDGAKNMKNILPRADVIPFNLLKIKL